MTVKPDWKPFPTRSPRHHPETRLASFRFRSPAHEWQGHRKPLQPVSVELDEKRRLQVFDRSGSAHRSLNLRDQDHLDILLSSDRQQKALLLKVSKEYDLVSGGGSGGEIYTLGRNSFFLISLMLLLLHFA